MPKAYSIEKIKIEVETMKYPEIKNYVGGQFVSGGHKGMDIPGENLGSVISKEAKERIE